MLQKSLACKRIVFTGVSFQTYSRSSYCQSPNLVQVFDHLAKLLTTAYKHSSAPLPFFAQYVVNIQDGYVRMMLVTHANYGIAFLSQPDHMTHDST